MCDKIETMMDKKIIKAVVLLFYGLLGVMCTGSRWRRDMDGRWNGLRTRLLFPRNFISVRINFHDEKELRIAYKKILCMETRMSSEITPELDVVIRQVTNGRRIVSAVFQGGDIRECDISEDTAEIIDFVSSFAAPTFYTWEKQYGDVRTAYTSNRAAHSNITLAHTFFSKWGDLKDFAGYVSMHKLKKACNRFYKAATEVVAAERRSGKWDDTYPYGFENTDLSDSKTGTLSSHGIQKRSTEPVKRSRSKRSSFDFKGVLIFPGTKWCGKGDLAACYEDLGDDKDLDSCCRDHDCCPYVIPPFTTKFNMFNYRLYSLLHCDCDQRFRGCLKSSLSTMANMIGKIYFNVLGSKCFEFEMTDICVDRSWYGRCNKYEKQETAVIKGQISFLDADFDGNQMENDTIESETV